MYVVVTPLFVRGKHTMVPLTSVDIQQGRNVVVVVVVVVGGGGRVGGVVVVVTLHLTAWPRTRQRSRPS